LIDHGDVFHFKREGISVRADVQATFWNRNDPVESGGGNGRVKIVDLIRGGNLSPEKRKSYVGESSLLSGASGPVIAGHDAVIGGRATECDSIPLIVGAHTGESAATGYFSFEVINMRRLEVRARGLIVASVFVEPRDWVWVGATVRSDGLLCSESMNRGRRHERNRG
jgi:hypothetical protein